MDEHRLLMGTHAAIHRLIWGQQGEDRIFHAIDTDVTSMHDDFDPSELILAAWMQSIDKRHPYDLFCVNFGKQDVVASQGFIRIVDRAYNRQEDEQLTQTLYGTDAQGMPEEEPRWEQLPDTTEEK